MTVTELELSPGLTSRRGEPLRPPTARLTAITAVPGTDRILDGKRTTAGQQSAAPITYIMFQIRCLVAVVAIAKHMLLETGRGGGSN